MAYWKDTWTFPGSTEYEYKFAGNYGAKGERRGPKRKATPEQIKKQNQLNKEKKMRRIIKANFARDDLWSTLKYPKGMRKPFGEVRKDIRKFLVTLRAAYRKAGRPLKFIYRVEVGRRGGTHVHVLTNRVRGRDTDTMVQQAWGHGRCSHESLYDTGGYRKLAAYIVKGPEGDDGQMSLFTKEEQRALTRYSCSRNLVRPEPDRKHYSHWTVRRIIEAGPKPTPGYYIEKDSLLTGVNHYTGMSYLHYTECRLEEGGKARGG